MGLIWVCDECGKECSEPIEGLSELATGRVLFDGVDQGQGAMLCEEHRPRSGKHQPHNCKRVRFYWPDMLEWNDEEAKPVEADYVAVDDCPAGPAIDMAVAKVMGLERLQWGDVRRGFGTAGYIRLEEEGKAYYLYTEAGEIVPIPHYSSSLAASATLVEALCAAGFKCREIHSPGYPGGLHYFPRVEIITPGLGKKFIIRAGSIALARVQAYLKAHGVTRVKRGPCGF